MPGKGQQQPQQNSNATSTTMQTLSPEQQTLLSGVMPAFQNFMAYTPKRYQGSTVAGFDASQTAGQNMALDAANTQGGLATDAARANSFYTSGDIWNPASNPYMSQYIDAAVRPITQQLTESTLPSIRGNFVGGGFGGSRQGIAEGLASGRASQATGDTTARIVEDLYKTNVGAQQNAIQMTPMLQQAQLAPALTTSGVGDVRQAMTQALMNEQAGNFNLDQLLAMAPYLQAKDLLAVIQGIPGGGTTSTSTGTNTANVAQANPWTQALGGAAAGASLGSMFGPIGTGIGAAGGAVLPFFFN